MGANDVDLWRELGQQLRVDGVRCAAAAKSGHPTSAMSAADLMAVLLAKYLRYDFDAPKDPRNDRLVFSKGHASTLVYAMFKAAGAISDEEMMTYRQFGSIFEGHPTPRIPWIDVATGSLGQGLPYGVGMALAGRKLDRLPFRVWVLCGDSEIAEGSQWEALEHAAYFGLDNLIAIFDVNRLGQRGETMHGWDLGELLEPRARRSAATRWRSTATTWRRSTRAYAEALELEGKPVVIVARTMKGKGVAAVEDKNGFHGKPLDDPEAAIAELGGIRDIRVEVAKPEPGERHVFETEPLELPRYELGGAPVATRKAYGDALAAIGAARGDVVAVDGEVSNSTYAEDFAKRAARALLRDVHRRAADGGDRGRDAGARLAAVRLDVRGVPVARLRLRPHVGDQPGRTTASPARTPGSRSARTARRRWRSRTSRRCARSTARSVLHPCDANQTAKLVELMAETRRDRLHPHAAARRAGAVRARRGVRDRRQPRRARGRRRDARGRGDHGARGAEGGRDAGRRGHRGAGDRPVLDQADRHRRRCAPRPRRRAGFVTVEDHWPEGGLGEAVLSAFADTEAPAARRDSSR